MLSGLQKGCHFSEPELRCRQACPCHAATAAISSTFSATRLTEGMPAFILVLLLIFSFFRDTLIIYQHSLGRHAIFLISFLHAFFSCRQEAAWRVRIVCLLLFPFSFSFNYFIIKRLRVCCCPPPLIAGIIACLFWFSALMPALIVSGLQQLACPSFFAAFRLELAFFIYWFSPIYFSPRHAGCRLMPRATPARSPLGRHAIARPYFPPPRLATTNNARLFQRSFIAREETALPAPELRQRFSPETDIFSPPQQSPAHLLAAILPPRRHTPEVLPKARLFRHAV